MPRVAADKREEYAETRRRHILEAALRAFSAGGFAETTMDAVATAVGVSKACLYNYFPTKDALLQELVEHPTLLPEFAELIASIHELAPRQGIPRLVSEIWPRLRERRELARLLVREVQSFPDRARIYAEHVRLPASRLLAEYLETRMARGELARRDPIATAQCLFGMLWSFLLSQELMGERELNPLSDEEVVGVISQLFLHGALGDGASEERDHASGAPRVDP
jgi:AcrR family transcriptional regulator